jgi:hypothetical protein
MTVQGRSGGFSSYFGVRCNISRWADICEHATTVSFGISVNIYNGPFITRQPPEHKNSGKAVVRTRRRRRMRMASGVLPRKIRSL